MRVGILGGSFDPVHVGHLWIAEAALESLQLDQVRWMPAATSPLKRGGPRASAEDRLQMVRLALAGSDSHAVDDREVHRGGVSYTVDTLAEMSEEQPQDQHFLIVGSDSLASFRRWHQPERLLALVTLAVVHRGGEPAPDYSVLQGLASDSEIRRIRQHEIPMPRIEISSSEIRERVASGRSIRFRTPRPVETLIAAAGLYREPPGGSER